MTCGVTEGVVGFRLHEIASLGCRVMAPAVARGLQAEWAAHRLRPARAGERLSRSTTPRLRVARLLLASSCRLSPSKPRAGAFLGWPGRLVIRVKTRGSALPPRRRRRITCLPDLPRCIARYTALYRTSRTARLIERCTARWTARCIAGRGHSRRFRDRTRGPYRVRSRADPAALVSGQHGAFWGTVLGGVGRGSFCACGNSLCPDSASSSGIPPGAACVRPARSNPPAWRTSRHASDAISQLSLRS